MLDLFVNSSGLIKLVLVILGGLSVVSWGIILYKYMYCRAASQESKAMVAALQSCTPGGKLDGLTKAANELHISPLAKMVSSASPLRRDRSAAELSILLNSCQVQETDKLESYLIFLATTGSTAPFIGLFGTVWGIMHAFQGIGAAGSASLAVVAPAIAEALVTTAAGLAAAIPAVMAYNFYVNWVRKLVSAMEDFSGALQALLGARAS